MGNIYEKLGIADLPKAPRQRELGKFCLVLARLQEQEVSVCREPEPEIETKEPPSVPHTRQINSLIILLVAAVVGGVVGGTIIASILEARTGVQKFDFTPSVIAISNQTSTRIASVPRVTATPGQIEASVCGESGRVSAPPVPRFLRSQGVSAFTVENTTGAVLNDKIRTVTIDPRGLWIGYFATEKNQANGVGHYDKKSWAICNQPEATGQQNINAIAIDQTGRVWAATEKAGVAMFDGEMWHMYTTRDGLPSNEIFGITVDEKGDIWVGTWEGVAKFDGKDWSVPYTVQNKTIFNNHVHAIAFDSVGDIWVGHVSHGVSRYRNADGKWIHYTSETSGLGGNKIRGIVVRKADTTSSESIWFATADGGVSKFEQERWTIYRVKDGLPSDNIRAVALDKYNRVWAATEKGVVYLESLNWITYNTIDTLSIAFGPNCQDCPFDSDHVWTGTAELGLTHSRLPYLENENVVQVREVCFESVEREHICPPVDELKYTQVITATYPKTLMPGERLRFEITVIPRAPYQLREDRGDFLANTNERDDNLFGTWPHIAIRGSVDPGQPFTFTDYDNPIKAPQLVEGEQEKTFTSTWRVWMYTRYVGPYIRIVFTVQRQEPL
jgi:hypothetical protein